MSDLYAVKLNDGYVHRTDCEAIAIAPPEQLSMFDEGIAKVFLDRDSLWSACPACQPLGRKPKRTRRVKATPAAPPGLAVLSQPERRTALRAMAALFGAGGRS